MRLLRIVPFLAFLCLPSMDAPARITAAFARPETTIASYWHNMIERQHLAAILCFLDGEPDGVRQMLGLPDLVELRCRDFNVTQRGRGIVDVKYRIEYRVSMGDSLANFETGDRLCLTNDGWRIVAPLLLSRR